MLNPINALLNRKNKAEETPPAPQSPAQPEPTAKLKWDAMCKAKIKQQEAEAEIYERMHSQEFLDMEKKINAALKTLKEDTENQRQANNRRADEMKQFQEEIRSEIEKLMTAIKELAQEVRDRFEAPESEEESPALKQILERLDNLEERITALENGGSSGGGGPRPR